jgi:hypothetical protein
MTLAILTTNGLTQHQIDIHCYVGEDITECVKGLRDTVSGAAVWSHFLLVSCAHSLIW